MVTTFIDRSNVNAEVFRRANSQIAPQGQEQTIQSIQSTLQQRRIALVGHILRQDNDHPIRIISFRNNSAAPFEVFYRRIGRARKNWLQESLRMVWQTIREDKREFSNAADQLENILQAALGGKIWQNDFFDSWISFTRRLDLDIDTNRYQCWSKKKMEKKKTREKPKQTTRRKRRAEGSALGGAPTGI